ncbi:60S ribosomal protein L21A (nucleomorph) [Lotharella oceanica]|uniref:60S ribosomal protein L21A n=1 Tax=Lotharella oceanica TaxID=641309 RepID=A0A060DGU1_9EUKA|nr:60S ribosomal protein L21A [Lotharella oceanica]|mmetsp:Transcript_27702/g.51645  ORF Transcript_27702/g.51645 Transcript_27702/m.51645 type:complete len:105 (-) Transcript_27702:859-1173(-)
MSKNKGARARTRKLFSKNRIQKKENNSHIRKTLYKINDKIIVKPNSSFQKDLPNKWYFGKIGYILGTTETKARIGLQKKIKNKKFFKIITLDKMHIRHMNRNIF